MGLTTMAKMTSMKMKMVHAKMMSMKMMSKKHMAMKMSMKMMKRMKMKSVVGKKYSVLKGGKVRTAGGLKKSDLKKNKRGKAVSKKASEGGKKAFKHIQGWAQAFKSARKALGIKGFVPNGGSSKEGKALLTKTRSLYKKN